MSRVYLFILLSLVCANACCDKKSEPGQTLVAVAANFAAPMTSLIDAFEKETGHRVVLTLGSSGKLFAQITNNAPFDVFLSADTTKPSALVLSKLAVANSQFTYAIGTLVLWQYDGGTDPLETLKSGRYNKLAIANPRLAPYGTAATQVLEHLELADQVSGKLVQGESIAQTYQFVATGNAQLGFVALPHILKAGQIPPNVWLVPAHLHMPIRQDAVLLKHGETNPAAIALLSFMRSHKAIGIIHKYGYGTVEKNED